MRERLASLAETLTKQDTQTQQVTNQLLEMKDRLESASAELRHTRAEKEALKASEARILAELKSVNVEKTRNNELLREVKKMYDDLDVYSKEEKRKLEERLDKREKELEVARKQVSEYMDEVRSIGSKRDVETREAASKIEKLQDLVQKTKEALDHTKKQEEEFSRKVHDLQGKLLVTEEKIKIYETRQDESTLLAPSGNSDRTRTLELQLTDLRAEVESLKESLRLEKERVETYKGIASASEEQLASVNSTYDAYKETMDSQLAQAKTQVASLEAKVADYEDRLNRAAKEATDAQEALDSEKQNRENEKKEMQQSLASAKETEKYAVDALQQVKSDLAKQVEVVKEAQVHYEREVVAHSKNIQALSSLREEMNVLRGKNSENESRVRVLDVQIKTAEKTLADSNQNFEKEREDLQRRIQDLNEQNSLLHSHMEKVNSQAAHRSAALAGYAHRFCIKPFNIISTEDDTETVTNADSTIEDLREVIRYLRREKDILSTRLDLTSQESDRMKLQLEHAQRSLDETRALLEEERKRNHDTLDAERKHAELLEKVNQLNLLRESNVTLREQNEHSTKKVQELTGKIAQLEQTIGPLKRKVANCSVPL